MGTAMAGDGSSGMSRNDFLKSSFVKAILYGFDNIIGSCRISDETKRKIGMVELFQGIFDIVPDHFLPRTTEFLPCRPLSCIGMDEDLRFEMKKVSTKPSKP